MVAVPGVDAKVIQMTIHKMDILCNGHFWLCLFALRKDGSGYFRKQVDCVKIVSSSQIGERMDVARLQASVDEVASPLSVALRFRFQ